MAYSYKVGLSAEQHDQFVKNSSQTNLLQSSNWAKIKDNWGNDRLGFFKNDTLVAVASVLVQPLPAGFSIIYIPRGPIMDYTDKDLVAFVFQSLKKYGKSKRALFVKFDPNIHLQAFQNEEDRKDNKDSLAIIDMLQDLGADWVGRTADINENIQPRFQANVYAKDFSFDTLPKRTKQEIRTARNKGLEIIFGGSELLPIFAELMKKTEKRKQISLRNLKYYQKMMATYPNDSFITLAQLDVLKKSEEIKSQLAKAKKDAEEFTENTKQGKVKENRATQERLSKEKQILNQLLQNGITILPIAATLSLNFGNTSENLYAGMDETYKGYLAPTLVWAETMNHAFELGMISQNMGGIENQLDGGLYRFKSKFTPTIEEFIGEFNLPVNPILYQLANLAYKVRKQLKNK